MGRADYVVLLDRAQPTISHNGKEYGPYNSRETAVRVAIDAAFTAGEQGFSARVLVSRQNGLHVEWSYGHDQYPPIG